MRVGGGRRGVCGGSESRGFVGGGEFGGGGGGGCGFGFRLNGRGREVEGKIDRVHGVHRGKGYMGSRDKGVHIEHEHMRDCATIIDCMLYMVFFSLSILIGSYIQVWPFWYLPFAYRCQRYAVQPQYQSLP